MAGDSLPFNVQVLRDLARHELVDVLDSVRGKKGLVIDQTVSGPLSLVAEFTLFKEHGVEKVYQMETPRIDTDCKALIYICRPKIHLMKRIAEHIRAHQQGPNPTKIEYSVFFVPRRTMVCERVLEEEGVYGEVTLGEFHLDLVPLDEDVVSMELDNSFRELYLDGDTSSVYYVAKAIMKLQTVFGVIPRIIGKGTCAKLLVDLVLRMRRELSISADESTNSRIFPASSEIDSLIIIDRTVDLVTPMCTQLTYEGLIDEKYGVRSTFVELDPSLIGAPVPAGSSSASPASNKPKKVPLNSGDKLYTQLRDLNFAVVGGLLSQVARRIHEDFEERHQARTVSQLKEFVGKLGNLQAEQQSLRLHTNIAEELTKYTLDQDFNKILEAQQNFVAGILNNIHVDYIEELIDKQAPLMHVLRLLCLYSLVNGGFKAKQFDYFRKELIQTYGYEHVLTLQNLAKTGLFRRQESARNPYSQVRKALRLIVDDVDEHQPNDISYVYSGYAPISVRLVQVACTRSAGEVPKAAAGSAAGTPTNAGAPSVAAGSQAPPSWKGFEEALGLLPGPHFEESQKPPDYAWLGKRKNSMARTGPKVTMVLFLGGCTFTEISAIRFLAQQEDGLRDYVIATTNIINGTTLVEATLGTAAVNSA
ncbi:vacuolar protein sorting-associated protein 33A [Cladochytrium replicatum]|nr:vacuolar protein sorting-associated protein 33A [Cladochytrium replicatum]